MTKAPPPSDPASEPNLEGRPHCTSIWRYIYIQLASEHVDPPQATKHERIYNFITVPQKLEEFLFFGYFVCLDAFLYNFTVLPLRIVLSLMAAPLNWVLRSKLPSFKTDILKGIMLVASTFMLQMLDSSRLYHSIRGQSTLKLYVIYNVLEVADKLCCSFGLDILDSFYSKPPAGLERKLRPFLHFILAIIYVFVHGLILFYQVITLNVAINSYSNALLTLLVSNQFVEIKSAVFKKFEKENLFQLSCADVVERFQLSLYLLIVGLRNFSELSASASFDASSMMQRFLLPLAVVYVSEIFVDWLKHAFITKFNHIHPDVYRKFCNILAKDFETVSEPAEGSAELLDQSPQVSRRIGFSSFPLSCLLIRVVMQSLASHPLSWKHLWPHVLCIFACLVISKLVLGLNLAGYCRRRLQQPIPRAAVMPSKKLFSSQSQMILEEDKTRTPPKQRSASVDCMETS